MASLALGVKFVPASNGTGDFVYSATVQGYRAPTAALVDGKTYRYRAESSDLSEWEFGTGVWSSSTSTLTRATVAFSSTGAKVSFTLAPTVGIIQFVEDVLQFDDAMSLTGSQKTRGQINLGVREVLTSDRTYSVATTGSDVTGDGTSGAPFATAQAALNAAAKIDFNGFTVTIQLDDGTYTGNITIPRMTGQGGVGNLVIAGNASAKTNVVLNQSNSYGAVIAVPQGTAVTLRDFQVASSNNGYGFFNRGGMLYYSGIDFGACSGYHIFAEGGFTYQSGNCTISGDANCHWYSGAGGSYIKSQSRTITASGTRNFAGGFAAFAQGGTITSNGNTFSGTYTGPRYTGSLGGTCQTFGGGASYFPGSTAGSTATGAQYA